jgi:uncharacterized membrane protein
MSNFKELLQASFKSNDTEEWLDIHFNRPIGLVFALLWNKLGIHPNVITILSIFLGVAAGWMFYYTDLPHNIAGVILLMLADFCDSTDGQMARLTGKKTLVGRVLDGASGDVWFIAIYVALCLRMQGQMIPGTEVKWGIGIWALACIAGFLSHSPQSMMADYYRQIHLFFLKGKDGSELDNYEQQRKVYESTPKSQVFARIFFHTYAGYCKKQEVRTPRFQRFFTVWKEAVQQHSVAELEPARQQFLAGSRPLMAYANLLTFNSRAILIYITCLLNCPWVYMLFEITVFNIMYVYMHKKHERLCEQLTDTVSKL